MKNITTISIILLLFVFGFSNCTKEPKTDFIISKTSVVTGEEVNFTNKTVDGVNYIWDFGDGNSSELENPTHTYSNFGNYNVKLTAYSKKDKKKNSKTMSISVTKANEIKYNEEVYYLKNAYFRKQNVNSNITSYIISLASNDIICSEDGIFSGNGNMFSVSLYANNSDTPIGEFNQGSINPITPQIFPRAIIELGIDFNIGGAPQNLLISSSGKINIAKVENDYILNANLNLINGETLTVYYKGNLTQYYPPYKK